MCKLVTDPCRIMAQKYNDFTLGPTMKWDCGKTEYKLIINLFVRTDGDSI